MEGADAGLCGDCAPSRTVSSKRGQPFYLCQRAKNDPRFSPYPRLPVLTCAGYEEPAERP